MSSQLQKFANAAERIATQTNVPVGIEVMDADTGDTYRRTTSGWVPTGMSGAVLSPSDYPGVFTPFEDDTAPTSAAEVTAIPDARILQIGLYNNDIDGTETVPATKFLYVSFNHAGLGETGVVATRRCIPLGTMETFVFSADAPLTKFAYKVDAAPGTGAAVKIHGGYVS